MDISVDCVVFGFDEDELKVLLIEQNATAALEVADRAYVLESGKVKLSGSAKELSADDKVTKAYLGH